MSQERYGFMNTNEKVNINTSDIFFEFFSI